MNGAYMLLESFLQVKNKIHEIRLAILSLENAKADSISSKIMSVLTQFDLWLAIKMIICDTTNTGFKKWCCCEIAKVLAKKLCSHPTIYWLPSSYLDRVLRHAMDTILVSATSSPNISLCDEMCDEIT